MRVRLHICMKKKTSMGANREGLGLNLWVLEGGGGGLDLCTLSRQTR